IESVEAFTGPAYGVDLFKLESPLPAPSVPEIGDADTQALFDALGRAAGRPWVMLSAGATKADFTRVLQYAYAAGANGYLAGRAIWWDAFQSFPDLDAMAESLRGECLDYMHSINTLTDAEATPWTAVVDAAGITGPYGEGEGFRAGYDGFGGGR
ncbi:MAG: tagatose-bisphosphate aldolase, partial [Actinobacteria bacterium]|nr:tagatose-bisphosphate aldolase [Actinomycetota bacterium]NIU18533.1 tagatose-bisphosphate aldolase [Actinomycetota bacterium]NIU65384.1 tagatose-bisphosphate aldolase [Actinomycetota bacterium]NIV86377.1 tagatose-bisphosphate aldolase [Actinomycetota bacterium]NIW27182.1 tagatose-bisphosphate aldolase [Actinomycetota bacterium]